LTPVWRQRIEQENEKRAADGVRVLGIGWHEMSAEDEGRDPETDVVFLGMIGMLDPLREEVKDAVHTCHSAGIRPVMITGDHPLIALNIGRGLGLTEKSAVCTGVELAQLSNEQLCKSVQDTSIYARVAPEHKLRIVDALQHNGEIVAMTGDGVNDAPALKEADIGVAMGITGTDVSKGAADMILQDDNFTTIVAAVEQGRVILDNIIRFVRFILSSNWAEILVMLAAPLFGLPLPLFAVQILWMNLVTDGLPALALGVEPGDRDVMRRPPRHPDAPIIDVRTAVHILLVGACMAGFSLWLGSCFFALSGSAVAACPNAHGQVMTAPGVWQTMLFSILSGTLGSQQFHENRLFHQSAYGGSRMSHIWITGGGYLYPISAAHFQNPIVDHRSVGIMHTFQFSHMGCCRNQKMDAAAVRKMKHYSRVVPRLTPKNVRIIVSRNTRMTEKTK
jgi:magnesium-transporting ATPase (P-type)